jgi:hypothetical protein
MLLRLTKPVRIMAGWLIALAYLFCVTSPAAALALGNGPAPCFLDDAVPAALMSTAHDVVPMMHMHADGRMHDHKAVHAHHQGADNSVPAGHQHDGKSLPGPCCAMLCVVALPAELPAVAEPARPAVSRVAEADRSLTSEAPPRLYRPPIA